jgi:ribosomal protein S18 acetylase RimI-like enzyme
MQLRLLTEDDFPAVHETFRAAFADYAVEVDFDADRLRRLMVRRGTDLTASVGAFDAGQMVAVMATGVREFEGVPSAYDTFTGVRPAWRGRRLATRMFDVAREELESRGIERFLLEVLQTNEDAIRAYTRAGFVTRRSFHCHEISAANLCGVEVPGEVRIDRVESIDRLHWEAWRDWPPSWQNSPDSVEASIEDVAWLLASAGGEAVGGAAVVPSARDLPLLAVAPALRRRGVGRALLATATRAIEDGQPLRIINVDADSEADAGFLRAAGARPLLSQFEMVLDFHD